MNNELKQIVTKKDVKGESIKEKIDDLVSTKKEIQQCIFGVHLEYLNNKLEVILREIDEEINNLTALDKILRNLLIFKFKFKLEDWD